MVKGRFWRVTLSVFSNCPLVGTLPSGPGGTAREWSRCGKEPTRLRDSGAQASLAQEVRLEPKWLRSATTATMTTTTTRTPTTTTTTTRTRTTTPMNMATTKTTRKAMTTAAQYETKMAESSGKRGRHF